MKTCLIKLGIKYQGLESTVKLKKSKWKFAKKKGLVKLKNFNILF